jgi:hypothetical protein
MNKLHQLHRLICDFCGTSFKDTSSLNRHIKTNKKCLSKRPDIKIDCVWCKEGFLSKIYLEKHNCSANKEALYLSLSEKYNELEKQFKTTLEDKDRQIKDLQEKLFLIANKPTTTNVNNNSTTTYNVTLECGKPMSFSVDKMVNLLQKTCNINYVLEGETGLGKWVIDHGCRNDDGELCIQTTDKNRGVIKYIDEKDKIQRLEKEQFIDFFTKTLTKYNNTTEAGEIKKQILDMWEKYHGNETAMYIEFISPKNKFFRHVMKESHKGKVEFINNADNLENDS